jgi:signal transduction histidine kinase
MPPIKAAPAGRSGASKEQCLIDFLRWRPSWALDRAARELGLQLQPAQRERVLHEQLRMVLLHTRFGTVAATAFAVLLALQFQHVLPAAQVQAWLALKIGVALARIGLARAYQRRADLALPRRRWEAAILWLLALDGAVWGLAGWRLAGESVTVVSLAVAALDAVSCIATFGLQVRLAATAAYVVPILAPISLGLALRGDEIAVFAGAGQFALLGVVLITAYAASHRLSLGLLLRLQADQLVAEKEAALALARERSADRDRFLAKVSHELRTPLHGILGVTRLMHLESRDAATQRRLELIESSGRQLQALINDLLDASVIAAGQFTLHEADFDLAELLDQAAEVFALRAADKGLQFTRQFDQLPRPCWLRGDAARVRQVVHNLLGNAVKFTAQGGVTLRAGRDAAWDRWRISVIDTGPGLAAADLGRVFEPFQQAGSGRLADGVGLGLTIAREIAGAMGGSLTAQSTPGEGAVFHFDLSLPAAAAPELPPPPLPALPAPPVAAAAPMPAGLPGRVLVVEDDEVNAVIVCTLLDGLGVRNERVADGRQAVQHALRERERPELVLMDCRMPVLDGLAATAEIRLQERRRGLPRLPIVALTAAYGDSDRIACLAAGMDRVIGKPFTREQLVQVLRDAGPAD